MYERPTIVIISILHHKITVENRLNTNIANGHNKRIVDSLACRADDRIQHVGVEILVLLDTIGSIVEDSHVVLLVIPTPNALPYVTTAPIVVKPLVMPTLSG